MAELLPLQYERFETFEYADSLDHEAAISETRQKYDLLRAGNYTRAEVISRFNELFGYMSPDYILHNYNRIFDISSGEMDEVILDILTRRYLDQALLDSIPKLQRPETERATRPIPAQTTTGAAIDINYAADIFYIATDEIGVGEEGIISISGAGGTHSFNITGVTSTSLTFNVIFPVEGNWGNIVQYWDGSRWVDATGRGHHATSGTYTISNLPIGSVVHIDSMYFDHLSGTWATTISRDVRLLLPPQVLVDHTRSSVNFSLDNVLINIWGPARTSRFMDATNNAFYVMHDLVGGSRPQRMRIESTRILPWYMEGQPGWPILWQMSETLTSGQLFNAIDHAHAMVRLNADTTETPIHEIAHNFENQRWLFEAEALAKFKTYYI